MEAVATTGLYPPAANTQIAAEIDAKYGLLQLAARAASPPTAGGPLSRASYPQIDPQQQQLIYRGLNNTRNALYGQIMSYGGASRPFESPHMMKRDELGMNNAMHFLNETRIRFDSSFSSQSCLDLS